MKYVMDNSSMVGAELTGFSKMVCGGNGEENQRLNEVLWTERSLCSFWGRY